MIRKPMIRKRTIFALLLAAATLLGGCGQVKARMVVKQGNEEYTGEKYQEALASYEEALALDPKLDELERVIGYCHMALYKMGDMSEVNLAHVEAAEKSLRSFLAKHPGDERASGALLNTFLNAGQNEAAIGFYEERLQKDPNNVAELRALATLFAKIGNFEGALRSYERIVELSPNDPEVRYILGVMCWEKSNKDPYLDPEQRPKIVEKGLKALEGAMRIKPDYKEAIVYTNLLYREKANMAKMAGDAELEQQWLAKADEYRQRAMELLEKEKERAKKGQTS